MDWSHQARVEKEKKIVQEQVQIPVVPMIGQGRLLVNKERRHFFFQLILICHNDGDACGPPREVEGATKLMLQLKEEPYKSVVTLPSNCHRWGKRCCGDKRWCRSSQSRYDGYVSWFLAMGNLCCFGLIGR